VLANTVLSLRIEITCAVEFDLIVKCMCLISALSVLLLSVEKDIQFVEVSFQQSPDVSLDSFALHLAISADVEYGFVRIIIVLIINVT